LARNGSGTYSLPVGYEATTGGTATATQHNAPLEDLATDMNTPRPVVAGGTGATNAENARSNLGVTGVISDISDGTTAINPDLGTTTKYDGTTITGRPLTNGETNTLGKGFDVTSYDAGTMTTGTFTPDPENGNFQFAVNGGAHTLAPPDSDCSIVFHYTNNASAGAVTTSGFDSVEGAFSTTDEAEFIAQVIRINGRSLLVVKSL